MQRPLELQLQKDLSNRLLNLIKGTNLYNKIEVGIICTISSVDRSVRNARRLFYLGSNQSEPERIEILTMIEYKNELSRNDQVSVATETIYGRN